MLLYKDFHAFLDARTALWSNEGAPKPSELASRYELEVEFHASSAARLPNISYAILLAVITFTVTSLVV